MRIEAAVLSKFPVLKNETFVQALKYFIVGGFCTVLDFALLYILTNFVGINYLTSSVISYMSGTFLNYYLCTFWIFKHRAIENRKHEFLYYVVITGIGLVINTALIYCFTEFLGLFLMLSKLLSTFVTYWWNFLARKYFLHTIR
ncbi:MAG: GtrA family protein [Bacteroidetes bacterium]|nr:GtrA family protein [Bacteroidota bacterium]